MNKEHKNVEGRSDPEKGRGEGREEGLFSGLRCLFPPKEVRNEIASHLVRSEVEMIKAFRSVVDAGIDYLERIEKNLQKESDKIKKVDIE